MNRCGYNHSIIPVCPVCGPTVRYSPRPIRMLAMWLLLATPAVAAARQGAVPTTVCDGLRAGRV